MNKYFFDLSLVLCAYILFKCATEPTAFKYMYNMNIVNPAYAGSKESISLSFIQKAMGKH
jgi:hypothetical protein